MSMPRTPERSDSTYPFLLHLFFAAAVSGPLGILLHELGHFFVAHAFGFPDIVLHFGSVTSNAESAGVPATQRALMALAGPLVTLFLVATFAHFVKHKGAHPWLLAPVFAVGIRSVLIGLAYGVVRITRPMAQGNMDEINFARWMGWSPEIVVALLTSLIVGLWVYTYTRIPRDGRWKSLFSISLGTAVGLGIYFVWLGPLVLP